MNRIQNGNEDDRNRAIATFWFMMSAPISNGDRPKGGQSIYNPIVILLFRRRC
ncbi:hypothetical protein [Laspinema olomoucense]|uniref:Uncharacterized protein n=1 Tax=Laspinema olomoucense D3b TaxID=2953688 RepID=A0ABT2NIW8_9CYAN|nr:MULTISPECIES: hypothetical protein [unclassified Laspinema]MCT7973789.1 hypothetical protein [Laspinema sp. D3d]MCT7981275.1 hypothetical protein [Laspinema sp. D3b]MCT7988028.1 hypothetical protein [Laspinema sp. D3a]MCT7995109.1 hypothetical protein [Laspinema sp. D3c]